MDYEGSRQILCIHKIIYSAWKCELWCEKVKLLDPQDLLSALSSFFELAFSFQLKYPKEAQRTFNILQLRVAKYGDPDVGTLSIQKKEQAFNALVKYALVVDNCG